MKTFFRSLAGVLAYPFALLVVVVFLFAFHFAEESERKQELEERT